MSFVDYLAVLRSRAKLVALIIIATTAAAVAVTLLATPSFDASVRLRVRPIAPGSIDLTNALNTFQEQTDLGTEAVLVTSSEVLHRTIDRLNLAETPDQLSAQVTVQGIPTTSVLLITAHANTPELAKNIANEISHEYIDVRRAQARNDLQTAETQLAAQLSQAQDQLNRISDELRKEPVGTAHYRELQSEQSATLSDVVFKRSGVQSLAGEQALARGFGQIVQPASTATPVRSRSIPRSVVFGILIGLPLAIAAALLLETLRRRIETVADAEGATGASVIGVIPHVSRRINTLMPPRDPFSPYAEAYRALRHNLDRVAADHDVRTVLVTSPIGGDGKSTTVANLAFAYGESAEDALVIDGDLRRPSLHSVLGEFRAPGLREFLDGDADAGLVVQRPLPSLGFVAAGDAAPRPDLVITRHADDRLSSLWSRVSSSASRPDDTDNDVRVVVDSAPILLAAEVAALAREVDGVLLVLRAGGVTREQARAAVQQIERVGGRLLGVVLTGATAAFDLPSADAYTAYRPRKKARAGV